MGSTISAAFASDNAAPAHPHVIEAIISANQGAVSSYGADPSTDRAACALREAFDAPDAEVLFALTGTATNIIALGAAAQPWQQILCSDIAHSLLDEAGGPVRLSGAQLTPLPSDDGLIAPQSLDQHIARRGDVHHSQPRIVTITQSTENGRVWSPGALAEFIDYAHSHDLLVHVDGARLANAIAALGVHPRDAVGDADIVTVGGTKNGLLFGDAVVVRRPEQFRGIRFLQKQIGHLASKHRFVSAQFEAILQDGLWLQTAAHANRMAAALSDGMRAADVRLAAPTEANEVFVVLDAQTVARVREHFAVHAPDPLLPVIRFVCSWATTEEDVAAALSLIAPG
ncbi:beta-eliminating lyase-related protein [Mycobacterium sp. OTB74]|uniref:threonine aldolase family protein n=1 Tax=Mycobacterium sp. OTB74 TaxID=1853452 RepID=UPI0024736A2F|nr:beta-eliminating lyase-related protein [Mycobacterium sp. OTB74]MDH6245796.1 threonine aldolase [Mycobacterium sp. OTB74]